MKVLHVPYTFHPDPMGGTEVYVEGLIRQLRVLGIASAVAAPASQDDAYEYRGILVRRYGISPKPRNLQALYGEGDIDATINFSRILAMEQPNIVHLHAFTRGVSLRLVRIVKAQGVPVIFTYHTPTVTCQRGSMTQWGIQPCKGIMDVHTCARCTLQALFGRLANPAAKKDGLCAIPVKALAHLVGSLPPALGAALGEFDFEGGFWTALRMTELLQLRHRMIRSLFAEVDHIVAVCEWVKNVLTSNGVPSHKVFLSRQGVADDDISEESDQRFTISGDSPLRIAFFGRLDPTKGVHTLIQALSLITKAELRLVIYGIAQDESGRRYEQQLRLLAAPDKRIAFHPPITTREVIPTLRNYDLLAVPSQCLETGPLVVMEAFAAGAAVIGSRLGGIAELIQDGLDGVLVDPSNVAEWANKLQSLSEDRSFITRLRTNAAPRRTIADVARDMQELYESVLARPCQPSTIEHEFPKPEMSLR